MGNADDPSQSQPDQREWLRKRRVPSRIGGYCGAMSEENVEGGPEGVVWAAARGRASGITLDAEAAWIARVRDRKLVDFRSFTRRHDALEAAGLRE
jgi:hypothetical protein